MRADEHDQLPAGVVVSQRLSKNHGALGVAVVGGQSHESFVSFFFRKTHRRKHASVADT